VLAARAVQQQTGAWPRRVLLHFLQDAVTEERVGSRLPHRRVLADLAARLSALRG
jgi:hypothetical protein